MTTLEAAKIAKIGKNHFWGALTPKRYGLGKTSRNAIYALGSGYRTVAVRWESVENRARQTPRNNVPIRKTDLEIY